MIVLHIASISNNQMIGVNAAVPQHIKSQSSFATVGFVNIRPIRIEGVDNQFNYTKRFNIKRLPEPFNKPSIVVFHECYVKEYLRIKKQLIHSKIPYIILPHGELTQTSQKKKRIKKRIANILLFNSFIKKSQGLQLLSQREMDNTLFDVYKFIGTNGIDLPFEKKELFNDKQINLTYIGRLEVKIKGLDLLIEAIAKARSFLIENRVHLSIYGPDINGRKKELVGLIEKWNVEPLVSVNQEVIGREKKKILLSSDLFIQTSRTEGMPLGILEAMSYGVPCVVTEGTSLKELIDNEDCGWTADNNANAIKDALIRAILEKQRWKEKGNNARRFIERYFDWRVISENTINHYKIILGKDQ